MAISNWNNKRRKAVVPSARNILSKEKERKQKNPRLFSFFWLDNFCPCQGGKVEEKKRKEEIEIWLRRREEKERISSRRKYLGIIDTLHRRSCSRSSRSSSSWVDAIVVTPCWCCGSFRSSGYDMERDIWMISLSLPQHPSGYAPYQKCVHTCLFIFPLCLPPHTLRNPTRSSSQGGWGSKENTQNLSCPVQQPKIFSSPTTFLSILLLQHLRLLMNRPIACDCMYARPFRTAPPSQIKRKNLPMNDQLCMISAFRQKRTREREGGGENVVDQFRRLCVCVSTFFAPSLPLLLLLLVCPFFFFFGKISCKKKLTLSDCFDSPPPRHREDPNGGEKRHAYFL